MELRSVARKTGEALRHLHWMRGLRAGLAVSTAMVVCHLLGKPMGWAALGGFEAILVDNGGPYRSRFRTIATLMVGGSLACLAGAAATGSSAFSPVIAPMAITAAFCFAVTFGRVVSQPVASTSVIILVIYFVALGSPAHSVRQVLGNTLAFALGALWAALLSLVLWPVDPFRPARMAVAQCYELLADFAASIGPTERGSEARELARMRGFDLQRRMRQQMESARSALAVTAARAPSRTVRARNLTVLLESADMLLVVTMRTTELALGLEAASDAASNANPVAMFTGWLSRAERALAAGLRRKPEQGEVECSRRGLKGDFQLAEGESHQAVSVLAHLKAVEMEAEQNIEIAREAMKAVWSGVEAGAGSSRLTSAMKTALDAAGRPALRWADGIEVNWTLNSVMMRHALRMTVVGAVDVWLLHVFHIAHGFWLAMTSIIVLQPYQSHTLKRGVERVGGTVAGGVLAALLAVAIPSQTGIIAVVTATSVFTLATYAVDYAWYCFFLTPTFVLMSLPHLRDWEYSGVRMLTTLLGAVIAVAAMRFLWPEREHRAIGHLLARASAADAAYVRATLRYWQALQSASSKGSRVPEERILVEREILAPARRAGGLASNDAEESLDRLMQESGFGRLAGGTSKSASAALIQDHALTFVTYLRRLRQSVTTLAVLGRPDRDTVARLETLAARLDGLTAVLTDGRVPLEVEMSAKQVAASLEDDSDIAKHQLQRMERQVSILERAASGLSGRSVGSFVPADGCSTP